MKRALIITACLFSIIALAAQEKPLYDHYLGTDFQWVDYSVKTPLKIYKVVETKKTEPEILYKRYETKASPYHMEISKTYNLELRDSTGKFLWRKENLYKENSYSEEYTYQNYVKNNPACPLVSGVYLEADGTLLLADSTMSRHYLQYSDGTTAFLPYGTIGMESYGWLKGKYWLMTHNAGLDNQNWDYHNRSVYRVAQTYLSYNTYIAMFNRDGSLYKALDLSQWNSAYNITFSPELKFCWCMGEKYTDNGKIIGSALYSLDGRVIMSQSVAEDKYYYTSENQKQDKIYDLDGYPQSVGWSVDENLFYVMGTNSIRIYDTETGLFIARLQIVEHTGYYEYYKVHGLSSRKKGLAFIQAGKTVVVYDYAKGKILSVIPLNSRNYEVRFELLTADGSRFALSGNGYRTVYSTK